MNFSLWDYRIMFCQGLKWTGLVYFDEFAPGIGGGVTAALV